MNSPHVLSFSANTTTAQTARFTIGTDIIDYMESSRTFGREDLSDPNADGRFQRRMVAIPDKKWNVVTPMVLTISNQNELYLVRKDDESKSGDGWRLIDLSQAFKGIMGSSIRVRAHAAAWTDHDRITIAVAVDDGSSERSRVFVAYDLSSRTSDWENISWIDCGSREDIRVEGIRVLDAGDGTWTVVLVGDRGPNDMLYLLRNTLQKSFAQALVFNPAVTLEEILDFEVAVHPTLGAGIAVLGINSGTRDLSFRPFPAYNADGSFSTIPPVEPLPCPAGANVLEAGLTKQIQKGRRRTYMGSDIYVGGQGVHLIKSFDILQVVINGGDIPLTVVASPESAPNVQDLIVGDVLDGTVPVWALLQNGDLNVVRKSTSEQDWGNPLRLRVGVQAIAPVQGDDHLTTSLLMVYANGQAAFLYKDANQGIWQERPLTVANPEEVTPVTCYGTTLRVLGEGSIPKPEIKVKISASVLSSVVLNGNAVFIGPGISFETQTDANGGVSLFDRVKSFTPAIYRFEIDGFDQCIDVNPANGVHERFKSITADELRSATISTPKGEVPLLPQSLRTGADSDRVDMVASSLNQVATLTHSASGVVPGVCQVDVSQPYSSTLRTDTVPDGYRWGIQADANGIRVIEGSAIDQVLDAAQDLWKSIKGFGKGIYDFFEGLSQGFKEGGLKGGLTFVLHKIPKAAENIFEFVCEIGGEFIRFELKVLQAVGGFFKWLLEEWTGIDIDKFWESVKLVFDWKDILRVKDAMVDITGDVFDYLESSMDTIKDEVASGIDSLTEQLERWRTETGETPKKIQKSSPGKSFLNTISQISEPVQDVLDQVTGSSVVTWTKDTMEDIFSEIVDFNTPDPPVDLLTAVTDFFQGTVSATIDELWDTFNRIQDDVENLFNGNFPDISSMSFETIKELLISIGSETLQRFINLTKVLILQSLDLVKKLVAFLRSVLFTKIRFPFIEKLVKLVTQGTVAVDTSFSFIEVIMLVTAIPSTITYKLIFKEAPLKPDDTLSFPWEAITAQSGTEDSVKVTGRISKLISSFLKLLVSGIKLARKKGMVLSDWIVSDCPAGIKNLGSNKALDYFSICLGGLSLTGSLLNYGASSSNSIFVTGMVGIEFLNWVLPSWFLMSKFHSSSAKKYGGRLDPLGKKWEKITKNAKKFVASTTVLHLILRTVDFSVKAEKFGSKLDREENSKITGYVNGTINGFSTCLSGAAVCVDPTKQVKLELISLISSAFALPLGITEVILT